MAQNTSGLPARGSCRANRPPHFRQTIFRVSRGRALSIAHRSARQASACNSHRSSARHRRHNSRRIPGRGRRPGFADYMPTVKSLRMTWGCHCVVSTVSSSPSIIDILRLVDQDHCRPLLQAPLMSLRLRMFEPDRSPMPVEQRSPLRIVKGVAWKFTLPRSFGSKRILIE